MGVKIRERKPGQWWVFVNYKGNRTAKCAGSQEIALAAKEYLDSQIALGFYVPPKREPKKEVEVSTVPTLKENYETFQKSYLEAVCRESTQERYSQCFDRYILPKFGSMPLDTITRSMVKEFIGELVGKKFARATIRIIVSNLCTVFSHAIEDGIIVTANPATGMPKYFKKAKVLHEEIEPLKADEVETFLAAAIAHDGKKRYDDVPEYYPLFLCAIHTGMRAGELAAFQWIDIDWHGKFIKVRRSIKGNHIYPPKNGKGRRIDMSDALILELQSLKKRRLEEYLKHGKNEIPIWVFCNSDGNHLDIRNVVNRHFNKCLESAKLRRIRWHDLSYVSSLIMFLVLLPSFASVPHLLL